MPKILILIPGHTAVWRYDQIAAIELVDNDTLRVVPTFINRTDDYTPFEYCYDTEDEAKEAFAKLMADWKETLQ